MPSAARKNDSIQGHFTSEHGGHYIDGVPVHPSGEITGNIQTGSSNVFVNGKSIARVGDATAEHDVCTDGVGQIASGSNTVFTNGKAVARKNDNVNPHTEGTCNITGGSSNVFVG